MKKNKLKEIAFYFCSIRSQIRKEEINGAINNSEFIKKLNSLTRNGKILPSPNFAILFIDLNGLRKINPNYSHQVDCETLKTITNRVQAGLRELDLVARFGADKFAIYLNETVNLNSAYTIINRLRIYAERPTYISETGLIDVGASIGIAVSPIDGTNFEDLLRIAYQRMQQSKIAN